MSINKCIILGRVGNIETRQSESGDPIVSMTVATSERWKDKATGEKKEKTEWHNISLFRSSAKFASQYVGKGDLVYLEGKITTEKYTDKKTNQEKYITKIIADEIQNLSSKKEDSFDKAMKEVDKHSAQKANAYKEEDIDLESVPF